MGNGQELNVSVLSSTLNGTSRIMAVKINVTGNDGTNTKDKRTYRNGVKTGEIERPFFSHLHNVSLERNFVVAISGVLGRDAVIFQHLRKVPKMENISF